MPTNIKERKTVPDSGRDLETRSLQLERNMQEHMDRTRHTVSIGDLAKIAYSRPDNILQKCVSIQRRQTKASDAQMTIQKSLR